MCNAFICIVSLFPVRNKAKHEMRKRTDAVSFLQAQKKAYEMHVLFLGL